MPLEQISRAGSYRVAVQLKNGWDDVVTNALSLACTPHAWSQMAAEQQRFTVRYSPATRIEQVLQKVCGLRDVRFDATALPLTVTVWRPFASIMTYQVRCGLLSRRK